MSDGRGLVKQNINVKHRPVIIVNRFFMKLFRTGNIEVVKNCQACFEFSSPSVLWAERMKKFEAKYVTCDRTFIHYGHCMN